MTLVIDLDNGETVYMERFIDPEDKMVHSSEIARPIMLMNLEWIEGATKQGNRLYIAVKHIVKIAEVD